MRTYASTPGRFRFSFWTWARCFPGRLAFKLLPVLFFAGLPVLLRYGLGIAVRPGIVYGVLLLVVLLPFVREVDYLRQKCARGDVNPAVVVSVAPYLIAVSANMGKRDGDVWPVIKIMPQPLGRTHGLAPKIGDRLPVVALYRNSPNLPYWGDFFPTAVACLTDDPNAIREALRRLEVNEFGPDHWERLEQNLARVPNPAVPGLYWMRER